MPLFLSGDLMSKEEACNIDLLRASVSTICTKKSNVPLNIDNLYLQILQLVLYLKFHSCWRSWKQISKWADVCQVPERLGIHIQGNIIT